MLSTNPEHSQFWIISVKNNDVCFLVKESNPKYENVPQQNQLFNQSVVTNEAIREVGQSKFGVQNLCLQDVVQQ